jgi:hypothetical protein
VKLGSLGSVVTLATHHDVDGRKSIFVRKKKNDVGSALRARLACIAEHARGQGGDWRARRERLAAASRACPSMSGGRGRRRSVAV